MSKSAAIQQFAYERYRMHWLLTHNVTVKDIVVQALAFCAECDEKSEITVDNVLAALDFSSSRYACFPEFLDHEYQDVEFMLSFLPANKQLEYLADIDNTVKIFRSAEAKQFCEYLKYWSNSGGELHKYGEYTIEEEKLPAELYRAYHLLWSCGYNEAYCYLTEVPDGYSVSLSWEFYNESFEQVQEIAVALWNRISEEYDNIEILVAEQNVEFSEYHEINVVFPAMMPPSEFTAISCELDSIVENLREEE